MRPSLSTSYILHLSLTLPCPLALSSPRCQQKLKPMHIDILKRNMISIALSHQKPKACVQTTEGLPPGHTERLAVLVNLGEGMVTIQQGGVDYALQQYQMKKQVLNINFKEDQGVILTWNYSDLSRKAKYFRHLLVLNTDNPEQAGTFVQDYVDLIKPGDLYATIYKSHFQKLRLKEWREKTYGYRLCATTYLPLDELETFTVQQTSRFIQNSLQQIGQAVVLNFLLHNTELIPAVKTQVQQWQLLGKMRFVNTIFSRLKESSIGVSEGVNLLNLHEPGLLEFYQQHLSQAAVEYAHLEITCGNGQLSSCNQAGWRNSAFNKIERYYHAPSGKYTNDILHIINTKIIMMGSYELEVALVLKTFSGTIYKAEKKLVINFNHSEYYNRTVIIPRKKKLFVSAEDIQLEGNPYSSETLVCFEREIKGEDMEQV